MSGCCRATSPSAGRSFHAGSPARAPPISASCSRRSSGRGRSPSCRSPRIEDPMKIVLREDVDKLGRRGEVVKVAAGYGRNYLIPKKLAYLATDGNLKVIEHEKRAKDQRDLKVRRDFEAISARIAQTALTIPKKVGENDVLFGSVTTGEIAELLAAKGIDIDRRKIVLDEPIKSLGSHQVPVRLHKDVTAQVSLEVVREE